MNAHVMEQVQPDEFFNCSATSDVKHDTTTSESVYKNKSSTNHHVAENDSESEDDIFNETTPIKSNQNVLSARAENNNTEGDNSKHLVNQMRGKIGNKSEEQDNKNCTTNLWTKEMVEKLKEAHSKVNPISSTFWIDISEKIEGKSAEECRDKWLDMFDVSTFHQKNISNITDEETDDDIFNSTPFRSTHTIINNGISPVSSEKGSHKSNKFQAFSHLFSSPILQRRKGYPSAQDADDETSPLFSRPHYKTYLKEVRAGIHNKVMANKMKKMNITKFKKNCTVLIEEGDIELGGTLSPGGTLHIQAPDEEDIEDLCQGPNDDDALEDAEETY